MSQRNPRPNPELNSVPKPIPIPRMGARPRPGPPLLEDATGPSPQVSGSKETQGRETTKINEVDKTN